MSNPTSKLNLVINGATTQLDIHDANAVDLNSNQTIAGNKEFTGTTTAHDLVPSATDTYNFGSSIAQWNNAYIKSLTINGVACGDILTHNASEFVNVSSDQTINGSKYFTSLLSKSNTLARGSLPTTNINEDPIFIAADKNNKRTLAFFNYYNTNGDGRVVLYAYNQNTTNYDNVGLVFGFDNTNNSKSIYPVITNACNLGTSTSKWKSFNGINPGALSLPSISSSGANAWIALDTTNWVASLATSSAQKYIPPADGWLNIRVDNAVALGLALTDGGNYMHQMVRSEAPSGLALLLPVFKNKEVAILVGGNENFAYTRATFYPCQGNV